MKILLIIISIILSLIFIILCGENGFNKYCENANECPSSVRCTCKSKDEINCFEPKRKKVEVWKKKLKIY